MNLLRTLAVGVLVLHCGHCQIFPFSNLRAFFDPKTLQAKDNSQDDMSGLGVNFSRPYRQTNHVAKLPDLHEFDSPDIFTINREIDNHRTYPVKRHPSESEAVTQPPPRRRGSGNRHHTRGKQPAQVTTEVETTSSLFITPNPNFNLKQEGTDEEPSYSKIKSKGRMRIRKPQRKPIQEVEEGTIQPIELGKLQITTDEGQITLQPSESSLPSEEPTFVESVPALGVAIRQDQFVDQNDGLVDYLVPPMHPSVYERNLKPHDPTHPPTSSVTSFEPPQPTVLSKKDTRFRIKKHRNHVKTTSIPVAERLNTNPKRPAVRRRPTSPHRESLVRKPSRQQELQQQAAQMDEQIASETGFTGGGHHPSHHGNERVEFQMHGQKGPHSYKFGYDTGKGHNRQFRYEEKDNHGRVKGHYGYYDKEGKLQIVNYEADPEHGYRADSA